MKKEWKIRFIIVSCMLDASLITLPAQDSSQTFWFVLNFTLESLGAVPCPSRSCCNISFQLSSPASFFPQWKEKFPCSLQCFPLDFKQLMEDQKEDPSLLFPGQLIFKEISHNKLQTIIKTHHFLYKLLQAQIYFLIWVCN